jgi:transglutaminase-like putative cysteine protease
MGDPIASYPVALGAAGTRDELRIMRAVAMHDRGALAVTLAVQEATRGAGGSYPAKVRAVYEYVRDAIAYMPDSPEGETIQAPEVTLRLMAGDCKQKSVLLAAMLRTLGVPARFAAVGWGDPGTFEHVYVQALVGPRWVNLDPTADQAGYGWAPTSFHPPMFENVR